MKSLLAFAIVTLLFPGSLPAQVHWKKEIVEVTPAETATQSEAEFVFRNEGGEPVSLIAVIAHCECTTIDFSKEPVPPGGEGKIRATFDFEQSSGVQNKQISVWSTGQKGAPQVLTFRTNLADYVEIDPPALAWLPADGEREQKVKVRFVGKDPVKISSARLEQGEGFGVELKAIAPGREYEVQIRRTDPNAESGAVVMLETDSKLERFRLLPILLFTGDEPPGAD